MDPTRIQNIDEEEERERKRKHFRNKRVTSCVTLYNRTRTSGGKEPPSSFRIHFLSEQKRKRRRKNSSSSEGSGSGWFLGPILVQITESLVCKSLSDGRISSFFLNFQSKRKVFQNKIIFL